MTVALTIGFIPLVDAGLLVAARDYGFAADQGLDLRLVREVSWTNLRDKLHVGLFDAAHMLAPAAIASSIGLGGLAAPMICPVALGLNGNAITVSEALFSELLDASDGDLSEPAASARALAALARERRASGERPLVFAKVFAFSSHSYLLRRWIATGGLAADRDVQLTVIPPPLMVQALTSGLIDGFCAGAPWNSIAAATGVGRILHLGVDIVPDCPEKVLAAPQGREAELAEAIEGLVRAIAAASAWTLAPGNLLKLARSLAAPDVLDMPAGPIERILAGRLLLGRNAGERRAADYIRLDPDAIAPTAERFDWVVQSMIAAGDIDDTPAMRARSARVFRPDIFARAMDRGANAETASVFDPRR